MADDPEPYEILSHEELGLRVEPEQAEAVATAVQAAAVGEGEAVSLVTAGGVASSMPGASGLAEMGDRGVELFDQYTRMMERCYFAALSRTSPNDWVLNRSAGESGEDVVTAMFCASGYRVVAQAYGITMEFFPQDGRGLFAPDRLNEQGDVMGVGQTSEVYAYRGYARARSAFTGQETEVSMTRWSVEDFTGRKVTKDKRILRRAPRGQDDVSSLDSDLRLSVHTGLKKKAVADLTGIGVVSGEDLERAWADIPSKTLDKCRKGHGYGSSRERTSARVADADVPVERVLLRDEVLSLTGGDEAGARALLQEITHYNYNDRNTGEPRQGSFSSVDRMGKAFMFERAWERLRQHAHFGPQVAPLEVVAQKRAAARKAGAK